MALPNQEDRRYPESPLGLWHQVYHQFLLYQEDLESQLGLVAQFHLFDPGDLRGLLLQWDLLLPSSQDFLENQMIQVSQEDPLAQVFQAYHVCLVVQEPPVAQVSPFLLAFPLGPLDPWHPLDQ